MKSIQCAILAFSLAGRVLLADQSIGNWPDVLRDAVQQEKLVITASHTGAFGGVHTSSYEISLGLRKEGDAASILFDACSRRLEEWASRNGAEFSTTNTLGGRSLRIKASSGHYLSTVYQPPKKGATQGTFNVVFVEPGEFLQGVNPEVNKPGDQAGAGQPAIPTGPKSERSDQPQPVQEGHPRQRLARPRLGH